MRIPIKLPTKVEKARAIIEDAVRERKLPKKFLREPHGSGYARRLADHKGLGALAAVPGPDELRRAGGDLSTVRLRREDQQDGV